MFCTGARNWCGREVADTDSNVFVEVCRPEEVEAIIQGTQVMLLKQPLRLYIHELEPLAIPCAGVQVAVVARA